MQTALSLHSGTFLLQLPSDFHSPDFVPFKKKKGLSPGGRVVVVVVDLNLPGKDSDGLPSVLHSFNSSPEKISIFRKVGSCEARQVLILRMGVDANGIAIPTGFINAASKDQREQVSSRSPHTPNSRREVHRPHIVQRRAEGSRRMRKRSRRYSWHLTMDNLLVSYWVFCGISYRDGRSNMGCLLCVRLQR